MVTKKEENTDEQISVHKGHGRRESWYARPYDSSWETLRKWVPFDQAGSYVLLKIRLIHGYGPENWTDHGGFLNNDLTVPLQKPTVKP